MSNAPVEEGTLSLEAEPTTVRETTVPRGKGESTTLEKTSPEEEESGVRVVVEVGSVGGVGLSVLEDRQLAYDQVANPGFSEEFQAEETVTVTAADGGAVQVEVNGEDLGPLGATGEQATRTFTAEQ